MTEQTAPTTHQFEADVNRVLSLVIHSLYSHKEIFLRELISNASDALDQLSFRAITEPELLADDPTLVIRLLPDVEQGTLTIYDTGMGMTQDEMIENLGTVAFSGTRQFLERLEQEQKADARFIGQFGVGFYSAFLVSSFVEVISRAAGCKEAYKWSSSGSETFTVEPSQRDQRGTTVILHLKEEHKEYLQEYSIRTLVKQYSDYVTHPIELKVERHPDEPDKSSEQPVFERINEGVALWQRPKEEITDQQYEEFYRHLTYDWEGPLARTHFVIEGANLFVGLLFVPKRTPFDLNFPAKKGGVRLYVKRVFIMDDFEELLPQWLRFIRGVIDSDDLPLNISRETLQDSRVVQTIKRQVTRKVISLLEELAKEKTDTYLEFWNKFGRVLKEGVHLDPQHSDRLGELLRYESSRQEGLTSLAQYLDRMAPDQPAIYYAMGYSRSVVEKSPHLELLTKLGYEVLYMTDAIDQWVVDRLREYGGKPLVSAMEADLKLEPKEEGEQKERENRETELKPLMEFMQGILEAQVREVRLSERLTASAVCLVIPEGGIHAHIERLLRLSDQETTISKRILEINPGHPLIQNLVALHRREPESLRLKEWVELLLDQALLTEGSPIHDPAVFGSRLTALMEQVVADAVSGEP
ncbi:MAG: molecular chaperone HtpG [Bradymonadales bacterium]|nr:molecular chaperone HtpG [Bradymonadales bacterium]